MLHQKLKDFWGRVVMKHGSPINTILFPGLVRPSSFSTISFHKESHAKSPDRKWIKCNTEYALELINF